jgi:hypothetical protein
VSLGPLFLQPFLNLCVSFQEWIEELKDLTTWRIIRVSGFNVTGYSTNMMKRSKPILLLDMIPGIPGMEWVRDCFQLPQHSIRPLAEPAVPRLSKSSHPQSHLAVATLDDTNGDVTLLLFQNSLNYLVLVSLGILNSFAQTPIVDNQVAPGTPLAIGRNGSISSDSKVSGLYGGEFVLINNADLRILCR